MKLLLVSRGTSHTQWGQYCVPSPLWLGFITSLFLCLVAKKHEMPMKSFSQIYPKAVLCCFIIDSLYCGRLWQQSTIASLP